MIAETMAPVKTRWRKDPPPFLVGKETRTAENIRMERSSLMERDLAEKARLALVSLPSVVSAEVRRDHHTTVEGEGEARFYVRWIRRTDGALTPDMVKMQFTRAERAARQFHEMAFLPCEGEANALWCIHYKPDAEEAGVYVVRPSDSTCSCPDWQYRHGQTGDICKHLEAAAIHQGLPTGQRNRLFPTTPEGQLARHTWALHSRDLDF